MGNHILLRDRPDPLPIEPKKLDENIYPTLTTGQISVSGMPSDGFSGYLGYRGITGSSGYVYTGVSGFSGITQPLIDDIWDDIFGTLIGGNL